MIEQKTRLGTLPFVIAGLSFIPLIGVLFGLVSITWGLVTKKAGGRQLAFLGAGGIAFSAVLYSSLFYFGIVQRGGVYDELRAQLSEGTITSLVQAIEFHKLQSGKYPETLEALRQSLPENSTVFVFDPSDVRPGEQQRYYHYELLDEEHYHLLGVGLDGQPFTGDDIVPKLAANPGSRIGLVTGQRRQ